MKPLHFCSISLYWWPTEIYRVIIIARSLRGCLARNQLSALPSEAIQGWRQLCHDMTSRWHDVKMKTQWCANKQENSSLRTRVCLTVIIHMGCICNWNKHDDDVVVLPGLPERCCQPQWETSKFCKPLKKSKHFILTIAVAWFVFGLPQWESQPLHSPQTDKGKRNGTCDLSNQLLWIL